MTIPTIDAKDEKKFHIRYVVEHFAERISENDAANATTPKPARIGMGLAADVLVVGLIAFPKDGGMGQVTTIEGNREGKPASASDLFSFWLNLGLQLAKHPELDEVLRHLAGECAKKVYDFLSRAVSEATPKKLITKA